MLVQKAMNVEEKGRCSGCPKVMHQSIGGLDEEHSQGGMVQHDACQLTVPVAQCRTLSNVTHPPEADLERD